MRIRKALLVSTFVVLPAARIAQAGPLQLACVSNAFINDEVLLGKPALVRASRPNGELFTPKVQAENRVIPRQDIFAAIQSAVSGRQDLGLATLDPSDLAEGSAIQLPPGYGGLQVTQVAFDPYIGRMRFRLLPKGDAGALPFYVTAKMPAAFAEGEGQPSKAPPRTPTSLGSSAKSNPAATPLVTTTRLAHLHLHSADMNMTLEVIPLQRGYLNKVIRVRLPKSGKTLQARVIGADDLDATL
jgi:hypothetical protein